MRDIDTTLMVCVIGFAIGVLIGTIAGILIPLNQDSNQHESLEIWKCIEWCRDGICVTLDVMVECMMWGDCDDDLPPDDVCVKKIRWSHIFGDGGR